MRCRTTHGLPLIAAACWLAWSCAPAERPRSAAVQDPRPPRPVGIGIADGPVDPAPSLAPDPLPREYRVERDLLLAALEDARGPDDQAALLMRLADLAQEHQLVDEEAAWLDRLVRDFPDYRLVDEALFRLGVALLDHDQPDVALRHMRTLLAKYPTSRWVPHTYLAFGDHFFEREEIDKAAKLYHKVLALGDSDAAPFAHHKLGWCLFNQQKYRRALQAFLKAVEDAERVDVPGAVQLRDEALKDVVRTYAKIGRPEKAAEFFERFAPERVDAMLEQLASLFFDEGKYAEAIRVHQRLMTRVECSTVLARSQLEIFEARLLLGDREGMLKEAKRLAQVFVELGECLPPEQLVEFAEVGVVAKGTLKEQAARYRAEFDDTREPMAAQMAEELEQAADAF